MNIQMSELMMSSPHNFSYIVYEILKEKKKKKKKNTGKNISPYQNVSE